MVQPQLPPLIACVNSSIDIVELLADLLNEEGFRTVTYTSSHKAGAAPVIEFLTTVQPLVCLFTISPPYRENWEEFESLRRAFTTCAYVLTTTHKQTLEEMVGPGDAIEVLGKPFDLDQIVAAVRRALVAG